MISMYILCIQDSEICSYKGIVATEQLPDISRVRIIVKKKSQVSNCNQGPAIQMDYQRER